MVMLMPNDKYDCEQMRNKQRKEMVSFANQPSEIASAFGEDQLGFDYQKLLEELRLHQAELEVQNDELNRTRLEAQEAYRYYFNLFDSLPILALVLDARGLIQQANQKAVDLFGFSTASKLRRHAIYRLMTFDSATLLAEHLRPSTEDVTPTTILDLQINTQLGKALIMEAHLSLLPGTMDADRQYLLLMIDRSHEHALAQDTHFYQTIINHTSALIFAFDRESKCLFANNSLLKSLGKTKDQLLGLPRDLFVHKDKAHLYEHYEAKIWATGQPLTFEDTLQRPSSDTRYFLNHIFPLRDQSGEMFAVGGISTDITDNKAMSKRLELAMHVFSQGSEGILITDKHNQIISVNRAFEKITGYQEAEVLGREPSLLSSGRQEKSFYKKMWKSLQEIGRWEGEIWNQRKSGEIYPQWLTISRVGSKSAPEMHYVAVFSDITQRKLAEKEIERLAFYDALTGLPNRYLLKDRATQQQSLAEAGRQSFGLAFIDLDHFKEVNDVHGHESGDDLLKQVVGRMRDYMRDSDTLARLGGDEFVWVIAGIPPTELENRITALLRRIAEPYQVLGNWVHISASIGLAIYPEDGDNFDILLKHADMAMYESKKVGRNTWCFFNADMAQAIRNKYQIENLLRHAVDRDELSLVYQPQINLANHEIQGLEALIRWNNPELGAVSPEQFIPLAEQSNLITMIDTWVLNQVCKQMALWQQAGLTHFSVGVNVSSKQYWDDNFVMRVQVALQEHQIPPHRLNIELTERLAMENADRSIQTMKSLKALGVKLSIDDFGTGYSSLAYLRWMPIDVLKIDKTFVDDIGMDHNDETICRSMIQLAKGLSLKVTAEGVETEQQALFLAESGCDDAQGYYYAKPMSAIALEDWLQKRA